MLEDLDIRPAQNFLGFLPQTPWFEPNSMVGEVQTWVNYQLVNYFLPISHYNWQWKVICQFNESISFNSTSFDQLVCQLLLILLLLMYSNSNLMGLIN